MYFTKEDLHTEPVPPGRYSATVETTRHTKSRRGNPMVLVRLHVREANRAIHDYFLTAGASSQAVAVSRRRLATLCLACGFQPQPDQHFDLQELHDQPVDIDVITEPGECGPWNRVVRYLRAEDAD